MVRICGGITFARAFKLDPTIVSSPPNGALETIGTEFLDQTTAFLEEIIKKLETLQKEVDIPKYFHWLSELSIGFTPLLELPEKVNPYARKGIHIFYKPEFLNRGGSGKGRPAAFMLYYYLQTGVLKNVKTITTAGFGNFTRALVEVIPRINPAITTKAHIGQILLQENPDLVKQLKENGVAIEACDDGYCPTSDMHKGKAISNAFIEEQTNPTVLMLDQHAVFKPFDGLLNAAGYFYSLVPEILHQTRDKGNLYYVNGEGTRGSLVGTAAGLRKARSNVTIVGLRQQEGGHTFGLRSKRQLGRSESLGSAEDLCDTVYEISDREAYSTMVNLWKIGVPATPSGGSYVAGALRLAEHLKGREGNIVTLLFDSLEHYQSILSLWIPRILGYNLDAQMFCDLKAKALKERIAHITGLRQGRNALSKSMMANGWESGGAHPWMR